MDFTSPASGYSRHKKCIFKAKDPKLIGFQLPCMIVHFIDDQKKRLFDPTEVARHIISQITHSGRDIDDIYDHIGFIDGETTLIPDLFFEEISRVLDISTRIYDRKIFPVPGTLSIDTIPGHTADIIDDGPSFTD